MGREIAQVMGHLGAGWLEREEREREERRAVHAAAFAAPRADRQSWREPSYFTQVSPMPLG